MKRVLFCGVLLALFCASSAQAALTYGGSYLMKHLGMLQSGNEATNPIYLFMNEVETAMDTLTWDNGLTMDNAVNNVLEINENSEEIKLTFSANALAWSSTSGVVLWDYDTIVPKTDQLLLDPVADAVGTVEGTFYYDSDDDIPYYRNASAWVALGAGTFAGGSITSDMTLSNGVDVLSTTTDAHTNSLQGRDIDGAAYVDVLRWTNGNTVALVLGAPTISFALDSTGVDISTAGAVSGVTTLSIGGAITGATDITASGTLTAGAWSIGTFSTTGATTLGDNTSTVAVNSSSWDVTTAGAVSGVTTLSMSGDLTLSAGDVVLATGQVVKGSTTTAQTIALQVYDNDTGPGYKNAILLTNGNTPAIAIGDNNPTVAIDSSDWDISTAGAMTGIGAITMDGLLTGTLGATVTGAAVNLNVTSNFAVNISTGTTNAQVTIGGGSTPFAIASTALDVSNAGAVSGVTTLSLSDDITMANGKAIKGSTTTAETIKLQAYDNDTGPGYVDAVTITNGNAPGISFGNNVVTVAVNSPDWDIDATGAMTGIGAITADGLITGSLGLTITAAAVSLNASSNFDTNINTGTSSGNVTIGGGSGTVGVVSSDWGISTTGAVTKVASVGFDGLSVIYVDTVELSNADIKALRATKKQLVAAPAAGSFIELVSAVLILDYGTNVLTESADNLVIQYATSGQDATGAIEATSFIDAAADTICTVSPADIPNTAATNAVANALELFNTGDGEYAGNAGNDSTMTVKIAYRIHPAGL
mgnify:FL=1